MYYNRKAIESVKFYDKKVNHHLKWYPASRYLIPFFNKKAGFYNTHLRGDHPYSTSDLYNGVINNLRLLVIEDKVYFRPYVKITFFSGDKFYKSFDTAEAAIEYQLRKSKELGDERIFLK